LKALRVLPLLALLALFVVCAGVDDCDGNSKSDRVQSAQQEVMLQDATSSVGMPAIHNFRERRLLKDILELRDQAGLVTMTYFYNEMTGKLVFLCNSIGYGIPYATQFTNPQKIAASYQSGYAVTAQADPNGLFSPAAADGTWVMCKNPKGGDVKPVYVEPRIVVSPFELKADYAARD